MKPRDLSTRERAIYDRLTLHARAALAPLLARTARVMAQAHDATEGTNGQVGVHPMMLENTLAEQFTNLPAWISQSLGGAL